MPRTRTLLARDVYYIRFVTSTTRLSLAIYIMHQLIETMVRGQTCHSTMTLSLFRANQTTQWPKEIMTKGKAMICKAPHRKLEDD